MKNLIFVVAAVLALTGCGAPGAEIASASASAAATVADTVGTTPPAAAADKTVLDEQAMLAAELAYKAARLAVETGVDAGLIKGETASRFVVYDERAYAALGTVRAAYRAGNAQSYRSALSEARAAISGLLALAGKGA